MHYLPGIAFIKDLNGKYVYYDDASWTRFEKRPEDIIGKADEDIWPAEDAARYRANDANVIETGRPVEFVEPVAQADGQHSWLIYKFPISENGKVAMVGGIGINITEAGCWRTSLHRPVRWKRWGGWRAAWRMISITCSRSFQDTGSSRLKPGERVNERIGTYMQEILNSARRASGLTGQLLAFSRRQTVQKKVLDLGNLLRNVEHMLRRMIGEHVDLTMSISGMTNA